MNSYIVFRSIDLKFTEDEYTWFTKTHTRLVKYLWKLTYNYTSQNYAKGLNVYAYPLCDAAAPSQSMTVTDVSYYAEGLSSSPCHHYVTIYGVTSSFLMS